MGRETAEHEQDRPSTNKTEGVAKDAELISIMEEEMDKTAKVNPGKVFIESCHTWSLPVRGRSGWRRSFDPRQRGRVGPQEQCAGAHR